MDLTLLSPNLDSAPASVPTNRAPRPPARLRAHWALTTASLVCFVLGQVLGARAGALATPLAIGGVAGCGFSWLLTRALFDPAEHDARWSRIVVAVVFLTGVISVLGGGLTGPVARAIENTHGLGSSTVLLLTFVEPFNGFRGDLPATEKRFRLIYVAVYAVLMGSSVLAVNQPFASAPERDFAELVKTICASAATLFCAGAVWFRARHPLTAPARRRAAPSADDAQLTARLERLLREEGVHASPNLKVADLARRLGEPEYKVSRCVTSGLGFANFNQMLNSYRIARATEMLADPALRERSILLIALDCGFASIGPFNRAFKAATGATPRAFRAAARREV
ncbi:AraC family transcriptional regulator [uncultured Caulobacter sp.]|uniref:helix-turn-helix domain-containing protein n=1 Tax=uncultured Caulobacter sp. TaxID=158749 RepID=UPI002609177A|nr:AraC family transcriptional regulator [uncultured Caulobacter sp.]